MNAKAPASGAGRGRLTRRYKLTTGSIMVTTAKVLGILIAYVTNVFLARSLGPDLFGLFGVAITVLIWLELIVAEGLPLWVARNVDSAADWRASLPRAYVAAQIAVSLVLVVGLFAAAPSLAKLFGAPDSVVLFRVASIDIPIYGLYNLLLAVLLGSRLYLAHSSSVITYRLTKLTATVVLVGMAGLSALGAVLGSITASLGGLAATLIFLLAVAAARRGSPEGLVPATPRSAPADTRRTSEVVFGSASPAALTLMQALLFSSGLWIVRYAIPGVAAGYYHAANLISQVPLEIAAGLTWALYAAYAEAHRLDDPEKRDHYVTQATRLLVAGGALWGAVVAPTARPLMALVFSQQYAAGAPVLTALSLGFVFGGVGLTLAPTLLVRGRGRLLLVASAALLIAAIAASLLLAPRVGAVGPAVAIAAAMTAGGVGLLAFVRGELKTSLWGILARVGLAAVLVAGIASILPVTQPWLLAIWYPMLALLFAVLLRVFGAVTPDDLVAIKEGMR